jgi:cation/acetate symporter
MNKQLTDKAKVRAGKISAFCVGIVAIILGILFRGMNVSFLVGWAFAVAASANLPAILMLLFWKKTTAKGIAWSIVIGIVSALGIIITGPSISKQFFGTTGLHGLDSPAIFSVTAAFITLVVVSLLTQNDNKKLAESKT